jgi:hypothetical protein
MTNSTRLEIEWLNHIQTTFPRRVNTPKSEMVYTSSRYIYLIWRHLGLSPIWTGVYSKEQFETRTYDKFAFDLDHDTELDIVFEHTQLLYNYLKNSLGREPRVYFSGKKGFHVYCDFSPWEIVLDNFKDTIRVFVQDVEQATGITTIDHSCLEPNRVLRLPFTPHEKSQRWCIPIDITWNLTKILKESIYLDDCWNINTSPIHSIDVRIIDQLRHATERAVEKAQVPTTFSELDTYTLNEEIRILDFIAPSITDGRHRFLQFMIVPRLVHGGATLAETHTFCKSWIENSGKDYNEYIPYVERSFDRNRSWRPWSFNRFIHEFPVIAKDLTTFLAEVKNNDREENSESN